MKIYVKEFDVGMEVKTNGIVFDVYKPDNKTFLGDFVLTKTGVTWCKGKTTQKNGKHLTWDQLITMMDAL